MADGNVLEDVVTVVKVLGYVGGVSALLAGLNSLGETYYLHYKPALEEWDLMPFKTEGKPNFWRMYWNDLTRIED